jgi:hypothetical protein
MLLCYVTVMPKSHARDKNCIFEYHKHLKIIILMILVLCNIRDDSCHVVIADAREEVHIVRIKYY